VANYYGTDTTATKRFNLIREVVCTSKILRGPLPRFGRIKFKFRPRGINDGYLISDKITSLEEPIVSVCFEELACGTSNGRIAAEVFEQYKALLLWALDGLFIKAIGHPTGYNVGGIGKPSFRGPHNCYPVRRIYVKTMFNGFSPSLLDESFYFYIYLAKVDFQASVILHITDNLDSLQTASGNWSQACKRCKQFVYLILGRWFFKL